MLSNLKSYLLVRPRSRVIHRQVLLRLPAADRVRASHSRNPVPRQLMSVTNGRCSLHGVHVRHTHTRTHTHTHTHSLFSTILYVTHNTLSNRSTRNGELGANSRLDCMAHSSRDSMVVQGKKHDSEQIHGLEGACTSLAAPRRAPQLSCRPSPRVMPGRF